MEIQTIEIRSIFGGRFEGGCEGLRHIKALPCLSVVQSVRGHYDIALGDGEPQKTQSGGAFIAPANLRQTIVHHDDENGVMEARWAFLRVVVNGIYLLEDLFDLPAVLTAKQAAPLGELIEAIRAADDLCERYAAAYRLTGLLMRYAVRKRDGRGSTEARLAEYIDAHYADAITKEQLAQTAFCSVPSLYRLFRTEFHTSPNKYINQIRLEKAALLLEHGDASVSSVAERVGFDDPSYFSRLFKQIYQVPPCEYRRLRCTDPAAARGGE